MSRLKKNKGFTLAEVLMVVAILAILFGLATPAVISAQKSLRQKELDTKAETIYMAVQNKLTELYTSGRAYMYQPSDAKYTNNTLNISKLPYTSDTIVNNVDTNYLNRYNQVYYIISDDKTKELLKDTLSEDLLNNNFVIEILPYAIKTDATSATTLSAASVYSVFYSEDDYDVTDINAIKNELNQYRDDTLRKKEAKLGYYGGSYISGTIASNSLNISNLQITSNELVNKVILEASAPSSLPVTSTFEFTFTFKDKFNKTLTVVCDSTGRLTYNGSSKSSLATLFSYSKEDNAFKITMILDDLSDTGSMFKKAYGSYLTPGSDISLEVSFNCKSDLSIQPASATAYGNTIYSYGGTSNGSTYDSFNDEGYTNNSSNIALISNPRHLQNLDSDYTSNNIKTAYLINDLYFNSDDGFNTVYKSNYYNGFYNGNPNYEPIVNDNLNTLSSFNSTQYSIYNLSSSSSFAGLFGAISSNLTISNISLVGEKLYGTQDAGGFVAKLNNEKITLNLNNCYVYLDKDNGDYPSKIYEYENIQNERWIIGTNNIGGLVGYISNDAVVNINDSFASTVISYNNVTNTNKNSSVVGGLVGKCNGEAHIYRSYSSSYLYGFNVSGLSGRDNQGQVRIYDSYVAGYIGLVNTKDSSGAGFVNGEVRRISDSYTIVDCYLLDNDGNFSTDNLLNKNNNTYYRVSQGVFWGFSDSRIENVYYKKDNVENSWRDYDYGYSIDNLRGNSIGSKLTIRDSQECIPYKLMGQNYSAYNYPTFANMIQMGDWSDSSSGLGLIGMAAKTDLNTYSYKQCDIVTEYNIVNDNILYGVTSSKDEDFTNDYTYFLYEYSDYGILDYLSNLYNKGGTEFTSQIIVTLKDKDGNDITYKNTSASASNPRYSNVTFGDKVIELDNGVKILPIYIKVKDGNPSEVSGYSINIRISEAGASGSLPWVWYDFTFGNLTIKQSPFTLTLYANGEWAAFGTGTINTKTYDISSSLKISELEIPNYSGYDFKGWSKNQYQYDQVSDDIFKNVNDDINLYANWEKQYTFNLSNKVLNSDDNVYTTIYLSNLSTKINYIPKIDDTNYSFDGWYVYSGQNDTYTKVTDASGNFLTNVYIENFISTNGNLTLSDLTNIKSLYAGWSCDKNYGLYIQVNSFTEGKEYIIANTNESGTAYALTYEENDNNSFKANTTNVFTRETTQAIRSTKLDNCIWKYGEPAENEDNKTKTNLIAINANQDKTIVLRIDSSGSLQTSRSSYDNNWSYSNNNLSFGEGTSAKYLGFASSTTQDFYAVGSAQNIYIYEKQALAGENEVVFYLY